MSSYQKLIEAQRETGSLLCVGLDPVIENIPDYLADMDMEGLYVFNCNLIDATSDIVPAFKLNFAFFEQYGVKGFDVLKRVIDYIPNDKFVIADVKRGDIGNSSAAYAKSCYDYFGVDAVTLSPYMGQDSIAPFMQYTDKFAFILALTSNSGSQDFQKIMVNDKHLYEVVVEKANTWADANSLGYVVGATHPSELGNLRKIAPNRVFLIPGIGKQGGNLSEVLANNNYGPALINVSRDIIYSSKTEDFAEEARDKTMDYNNMILNASI